MSYQHIGFIGLGLIGGSLSKLIRQHDSSIRLFGFAKSKETIHYALSHHVIDTGTTILSEIPKDLDLVFICTPISLINYYIDFMTRHIFGPLLITDVGSIKQEIGRNIPLQKNHIFVGGHPMAGIEKTGIQFSTSDLLEQATYILIKQEHPQYTKFVHFIKKLGFNLLELNRAKDHDYLVAYASHLPYLMAHLAVKTLEDIPKEKRETFEKVIASGFYDTTRVASSSVEWGIDVCQNNREILIQTLQSVKQNLDQLESLLTIKNWGELFCYLSENKKTRDRLQHEFLRRSLKCPPA